MSEHPYRVRIYPSAENDLREIKDYFENKLKASPAPLFGKLTAAIDTLEVNPLIYPFVKDPYLRSLGYRMVPIDHYLLFYVIDRDLVQIHRFLYGKRNYQDFL